MQNYNPWLRRHLMNVCNNEPYKIYFTYNVNFVNVHELKKVFVNRFHVLDISVHDGYGYVYVNDSDAARKVNLYKKAMSYRETPLTMAEGLTYRGNHIVPITDGPSSHKSEKSVETEFNPEGVLSELESFDWATMGLTELKSLGKSLQGILVNIQSAYKSKLCVRPNDLRVLPYSKIPDSPLIRNNVHTENLVVLKDPAASQNRNFKILDDVKKEKQEKLSPGKALLRKILGNVENTPEIGRSQKRKRAAQSDMTNMKHMKILKERLEQMSPIGEKKTKNPLLTSTPQNMSFVNQ
ncbi:unnamed protein product [Bursaphelenchus okinawaensis]|uniref:Uncharacterized protein n=1 Tax=Bursaphelenchus okinawaensis TaxID=465554 RepID=A0A811L9T7_9BILA|nr:unnamed protein product [Bursaphelenchus okinawaensis]CAG9120441.1 unnamed protein product [Bursaphelenchus okinawaensis]